MPLFYPFVAAESVDAVVKTLGTRWIGQGPQVDQFEARFSEVFAEGRPCIAVSAGTHALHLANVLAGIQEGDEVIAPVFSCAATNVPLLYQRAKIRFADVQRDTLNIDPEHVRRIASPRTKAIVCVHYGGLPADLQELESIAHDLGVPLICDAAQALGATYRGRPISTYGSYTIFSFQAIKHITTGDGGLLVVGKKDEEDLAKRLRWFGIDRNAKRRGNWDNQIVEVGFKYHMNDIAAGMGLAAMSRFAEVLEWRQRLFAQYSRELEGLADVKIIGAPRDRTHAAWIFTIRVERRRDLERKLAEHGFESGQVHYRNDRYEVFGGRRADLPNMDAIEDEYLVLPLHMRVTTADVQEICQLLRSGW